MKGVLMRPPPVAALYDQKLTHQNHLKKLENIRTERRQQLQSGKSVDLSSLKDIKSRSFAHKFNATNYQIAQSNLKFLVKLEKVKPFTTHTAKERPPPSFPSAIAKRRIIQTERENSRIFMKMKSVSSNLSRERMGSDYAKAEKIRERITRYAVENSKVSLKSEKYFSGNHSIASERSLRNSPRNSLVSHYRREDIVRNKVSHTDIKDISKRAFPSLGKEPDYSLEEQKAFFTTEPLRNKRVFTQRKKLK